MKRTLVLLAAMVVAVTASLNAFASEPDKPGTKLITIQGGYGPGIGAVLSGNIAMANLGASHLYGGLQLIFGFKSPKWQPGLILFILWMLCIVSLCVFVASGFISHEVLTI